MIVWLTFILIIFRTRNYCIDKLSILTFIHKE